MWYSLNQTSVYVNIKYIYVCKYKCIIDTNASKEVKWMNPYLIMPIFKQNIL